MTFTVPTRVVGSEKPEQIVVAKLVLPRAAPQMLLTQPEKEQAVALVDANDKVVPLKVH